MKQSRTFEEHSKEVQKLLKPRQVVDIPVGLALGRTLNKAVLSPEDSPAFDNSQMDGYALSKEHLTGGTYAVGPAIAAGDDPAILYPTGLGDKVAPIMTGARVPGDVAAIVPVENCKPSSFAHGGKVHVPGAEKGALIRKAGSDLINGEELFPVGHVVNARTVGAAALLGIETVPVLEPSRVVICTGGDEIGGSGPAQIRDANGPMLHSLCEQYCIQVVAHVKTSDSTVALKDDLRAAIQEHRPNAVITSGGISQGKFEVVRTLLEPFGGWFGHVKQQPGGPQGLALFCSTPIICLPGNPVSTAVSFRLFAAPVLGEAPKPFTTIAKEKLYGIPDKDCFVRGRVQVEGGVLRSTAVGGRGSHLLAQSVDANAILRIPAETQIEVGEEVQTFSI